MTRRFVFAAVAGAMAVAFAGSAGAQMNPSMKSDPKGYVPGTAPCTTGYACNGYPTPTDGTVKSGVYNGTMGLSGNLCWRTGYWAPSMATIECDPDLVPKPPPPPPPAAVPPPPPPPAAAPMKKKIVLRGVNFDFDKSNIRPDAVPTLEQACKTLKEEPTIDVSCNGYTDSVGTVAYNLKLSERRARAVCQWLVQCGVGLGRVSARGYGKADPVASNATPEGRAQNRRTELVVPNQP